MRPIDELAAEICTLAGHINAAHHRWLVLIAEFDQRTGWSDSATQSCAHWLNWKCGMAMGAAREKVRVARALNIAAFSGCLLVTLAPNLYVALAGFLLVGVGVCV